jgi:hypothetical protein
MDRVWLGGWPNGGLKRFDPATGMTVEVQIPGSWGADWGVRGVGIDTHGNVWAAIHKVSTFDQARVARVTADTATPNGVWTLGGSTPVGVGVDFDGHVWTVNQSTSNASKLYIDPNPPHDPIPDPADNMMVKEYPTGPNPYTYSDFTGLGLRTITRPTGDYTTILQGCGDGSQAIWTGIELDTTTPPNTSVELYVRVGDDIATIDQQMLYGPWTTFPADLTMAPGPVPDAKYLQLIIRLISDDGESSPIVHGYLVQAGCQNIPG